MVLVQIPTVPANLGEQFVGRLVAFFLFSAQISLIFFNLRNNNPERFGGQPQKSNIFGVALVYACVLVWLYFVYGADIQTTAFWFMLLFLFNTFLESRWWTNLGK